MKRSELAKKRQTLTKERTKLAQDEMTLSRKVMRVQRGQIEALFEKLKDIVSTYAKKNKIDLVLLKSAAVTISDPKLDITAEIKSLFETQAAKG